MRRGSKPAPFYPPIGVEKQSDTAIGFNLSADFVSEHEWGIKNLHRVFGITLPEYGKKKTLKIKGATARTITCVSDILTLTDLIDEPKAKKRSQILYYQPEYGRVPDPANPEPYNHHVLAETSGWGSGDLSTAWDSKTFAVRVWDKWFDLLKELHEAFKRKDVAIWLGGSRPFQNGGLILAIASRIPQYALEVWEDADDRHNELIWDSNATGITEKLKAAKKTYFALSPHRLSTNKKSKYDVMYWLNPMEQHANNSGWYTVEDLELWIKNEGPIPMQKERR